MVIPTAMCEEDFLDIFSPCEFVFRGENPITFARIPGQVPKVMVGAMVSGGRAAVFTMTATDLQLIATAFEAIAQRERQQN